MEIAAAILLILSVLVFATSALGLWRMPDFYCRIHTVGMTDTLGIFALILALILLTGDLLVGVKLVFLGLMILVINPVVAHLIGRAGYERKVPTARKRQEGKK